MRVLLPGVAILTGLLGCGAEPRATANTSGGVSPDAPTCESLEQQGLLCRENWCWMLEGQQGLTLTAVQATGASTLFAVGYAGTILRREAGRWQLEASGTDASLFAIDAPPGGEPWVVGTGATVLRRTAEGWSVVPAPREGAIRALIVPTADEPWIATERAVHRWREGAWERLADAPSAQLAIDDAGIVWAKWDGELRRWTGTSFVATGDAEGTLLPGRFRSPLLAAGHRLLRWNGSRADEVFALPSDLAEIRRAKEAEDGSLWVIATRPILGGGYNRESHHLYSWDGVTLEERWSEPTGVYGDAGAQPQDLTLADDGVVLVGRNGRTVVFDGVGIHEPERLGPVAAFLPLAEDDIWTIEYGPSVSMLSRRWNGTAWAPAPFSFGNNDAASLSGSTPDDLWAVDGGWLRRWNGHAVEIFRDAGAFRAVLAVAADDVWAVGREGSIAHWDGGGWTTIDSGTDADLEKLWAGGPDDVWAAGETLLHWDGATWSTPPGIPAGDLRIRSISGAAPDDVWAAGNAIWHWNGDRWSTVEGPRDPREIWTAGGDAVFVGTWGYESGWYRRDGNGWRRLPFESGIGRIEGPPSLGIGVFGDAFARFCR